jgi:hypothetical protein
MNKAYAEKFNTATKVIGWCPGQDLNLGLHRGHKPTAGAYQPSKSIKFQTIYICEVDQILQLIYSILCQWKQGKHYMHDFLAYK